MLFYENLDKIIFHRNELFKCDELIIISGYVGPKPVTMLKNLPLKATVVYGMYGSDGIRQGLHKALLSANKNISNIEVLYSSVPVHAKCYVWKYKGEVVHALIGSANFSTNGIETPFKEVLAETTVDTFGPLSGYIDNILNVSISCDDAVVKKDKKRGKEDEISNNIYDPDVCSMPLYVIGKDGCEFVPEKSGINWGMARKSGSHVNINDAYIRIGKELIEHYPLMFPSKQKEPRDKTNVVRKDHRHNDSIDIIWDDGTTMTGLLEGSVPKMEDGIRVLYPKQLSTTPQKSLLGKYLRERLNVSEGEQITMEHLERYGRKTIDVSLQGEGIYYFDFSVEKNDDVLSFEACTPQKDVKTLKVAEKSVKYNGIPIIESET